MKQYQLCAMEGRREAVRFVAVSQPYAGAWLNAVPSKRWFRISSWLLRVAVWRRLGLPVVTGGGEGARLSKHGKAHDRLGDVAQSDGHAGHAERHTSALAAFAEALRGAFGASRVVTPDTDRHAGWAEVSPDYRGSWMDHQVTRGYRPERENGSRSLASRCARHARARLRALALPAHHLVGRAAGVNLACLVRADEAWPARRTFVAILHGEPRAAKHRVL
jgi:hypothetical protein